MLLAQCIPAKIMLYFMKLRIKDKKNDLTIIFLKYVKLFLAHNYVD